jgi:hypothetical protein
MRPVLVALLAIFCTVGAQAEALYRCEVVNVREVSDDGKLASSDWTKTVQRLHEVIIFDSKTGLFRFQGESRSWEFEVYEAGNENNAMKAARMFRGAGSFVMETIRINTFSNSEFIYVAGDLVRTGTCETL